MSYYQTYQSPASADPESMTVKLSPSLSQLLLSPSPGSNPRLTILT